MALLFQAFGILLLARVLACPNLTPEWLISSIRMGLTS
jgi:hypothetical protein